MAKFEFTTPQRIIFGFGEFSRVGELSAGLGRSALVIYNGPGLGERAAELLRDAGVAATLRRQHGEPIVTDVDDAVAAAQQARCDMVIGLGGGSAIDAAKATAGLLTNGGSAVDYMEVVGRGLKITRASAPWIAIPTTAGTGAEATRNAVIGLPEKHFKASLRSEHILPRIALIDPQLGLNVPPGVTARCGMDALCQLIESYTSNGAQPMTDALASAGIPLAARALPRAHRDGSDQQARHDMALAALWSGIALANAGLGAVHGFAAPLGANFPVPHGVVCAALLPHIIAANLAAADEKLRTRYANVGRWLTGDAVLAEKPAAQACIDFTARLVSDLKIPPLREFGVAEARVPEMVALARKASSMRFNPVILSDTALAEALNAAIRGA